MTEINSQKLEHAWLKFFSQGLCLKWAGSKHVNGCVHAYSLLTYKCCYNPVVVLFVLYCVGPVCVCRLCRKRHLLGFCRLIVAVSWLVYITLKITTFLPHSSCLVFWEVYFVWCFFFFCKSWYQERSSTEYCLFCFVEKRCIESGVFYFILFYLSKVEV